MPMSWLEKPHSYRPGFSPDSVCAARGKKISASGPVHPAFKEERSPVVEKVSMAFVDGAKDSGLEKAPLIPDQ